MKVLYEDHQAQDVGSDQIFPF